MPVAGAEAELFRGDQAESFVGRQLGQYQVVSLLGEGGMVTVYLPWDKKLDGKVALKLLPTEPGKQPRRRACQVIYQT